ncbi:MAG: sigma 54-interacting transcriptional regulator [Pseudomonadota bacterium]
MADILVVDDDLSMREFLELLLAGEGYLVDIAASGEEALQIAAKKKFDLVISDIRMKKVDGIGVLKGVKALSPETVVILISAFATVESAVTAMKEGAYDFIPKPFKLQELKAVVGRALAHRNPEEERRALRQKVREGCHFGSLVGLSPPMLKVYDLIQRTAQTFINVLITGESGTGKELAARAIHENSPRAKEHFVAVNCGGMPEQLIESELFGHRKGSFTGAAADKPGLFELAHKGTIFLDELAELSLPMQVKLLRVVQDKTYRPVGDARERLVDARIIAATNRDLEAEVIAGRFREDLYYRINVINIQLPPLRERKGDIPLLAQFFLEKYSKAMNKDVRKVSAYALDILGRYDFPGNVRELENIVERSVALEQSSIILPESLTLASFKQRRRLSAAPAPPPDRDREAPPAPEEPAASFPREQRLRLEEIMSGLERYYLLLALRDSKGLRYKTAELLGISPWRLRGRVSNHGLGKLDSAQIDAQALTAGPSVEIPRDLLPDWTGRGFDLDGVLLRVERHFIDHALERSGGSKTKAAEFLGVSRRSFLHRLDRSKP